LAIAGFTAKKGEGAIWFPCDCIYMVIPEQFAVDIYAFRSVLQ